MGRQARPVPAELRSSFIHLYLDIAWFGVLSGSSTAFAAIFATRLGADALQIGLLNAGPAAMGLLFTLPAGRWLESRPIGKAVFWTSVFHRLGFFFWILLPWLLRPQGQIWALVSLTLLAGIPGTVLAVAFNAMFATAVPPQWRGHVVGTRNALLAVTYLIVTLLCGIILENAPFPLGYQVVFAIGFVGAAMSSVHLWYVRSRMETGRLVNFGLTGRGLGELGRPGHSRTWGDGLRWAVGLRFLTRSQGKPLLRTEILRTSYGRMVGVLLAFHLAQFMAIPLFPLYWVRELNLTDQEISLGTALFQVVVFLGSTQLARVSERLGYHRVTVVGAVLMSLYPFLTAASHDLTLFLVTAAVGGVAWSLAGGGLSNYILERVPENDRPAHLAWYNLALNGAVLLGVLCGSFVAEQIGLALALGLAAGLRLLAALAIWRWG